MIRDELSRVYRALVSAFHGIVLPGGASLQASTKRMQADPSLYFQFGNVKSVEHEPFKYEIAWDIPAQLTIQSPPSDDGYQIADAIAALYEWCAFVKGLPLSRETGELVPYSIKQIEMMDQGKLKPVAERFAGPEIQSVRVRPEETTAPNSIADLLFHIEFVANVEPEIVDRVTVLQVGANIYDQARASMWLDLERKGRPIPVSDDTYAQGGYAEPETTLSTGGKFYTGSFPPLGDDVPMVKGGDPSKTPMRIDIAPAAFSLSVGTPTQQLQVIQTAQDLATTQNVTAVAQYASSAAGVATVDSSGLVTRVGAGSATITATYLDLTATASVSVS